MKKILYFYILLTIMWVVAFFLIFCNQLLNLKYEIEEVCDNITITNLYQYTYSISLLCIVWFFLNLFWGLYLYICLKKNWSEERSDRLYENLEGSSADKNK